MSDVFGKPTYGSGGKKHYFKIKEGQDQILRILPPYGSQRATGKWALYYSVQFGYKDLKGYLKPFESCEVKNRQTKMIEVEDAASTRIRKLKSELEKAKIEGNVAIQEKLKTLLKTYNTENKWHMLAVDLNGKIGLVSIPHKHKLALDKEISTLRATGVDPVSVDNGRFFVFSKSGMGPQTIHGVRVYKEVQNLQTSAGVVRAEVDKIHNLLETDIPARMAVEAADLGSLYKKPSPEQIRQMVEGGPAAVQAVMDTLYGSASTAAAEIAYDIEPEEEEESSAPVAAQVSTQVANVAVQAPVQQTAQNVFAQPAATSKAVDVASMTDAEFKKMMNL